ncbi:hypothetical protein [Bradyrhizobium yuanmingense]|uniref:hypothetical protein n=1 Tax=Bradyrhizobium yuanmingense TaxID=108015 RepID=UPI0035135B96
MRRALFFLLVLFLAPVNAQTLDEQERANQLRQIEKLKQDVFAKADGMVLAKKSQCLAAIADEVVCECFGHQLPVIVNFVQYVAIVSKTKDELEYDKLKPADKMMVDYVRKARDACVSKRTVAPARPTLPRSPTVAPKAP